MRIWTLHPQYLDLRGLTALWREALLAQKVLQGGTKGYRSHPQLDRFKARPEPSAAIAAYLCAVQVEARQRGYRFDAGKIGAVLDITPIPATEGQLAYEWAHLQAKLQARDPDRFRRQAQVDRPKAHPLFQIVPGGVEPWEKVGPSPPPKTFSKP